MTETDPIQCSRCGCFLSGPKGPDGCNHCGHLNGHDEETRMHSAVDQIHAITGDFWGIQEDGDARAALERVGQIVLQTLARHPDCKGTFKGGHLTYEPHPSELD